MRPMHQARAEAMFAVVEIEPWICEGLWNYSRLWTRRLCHPDQTDAKKIKDQPLNSAPMKSCQLVLKRCVQANFFRLSACHSGVDMETQ